MAAFEEKQHDLLLIIAVLLFVLFSTGLGIPSPLAGETSIIATT